MSTSSSCDIRVAAAGCTKNDGEKSVFNIMEKVNIPTGTHTAEFVRRSDLKREKRSDSAQLKESKKRRIELKQKREMLRIRAERVEGTTYQSNCGINEFLHNSKDSNNNNYKPTEQNINIVYFDIETTGLAADAHILQIAAVSNDRTFSVYIYNKKKRFLLRRAQLHSSHVKMETYSIKEKSRKPQYLRWINVVP